MIDKDKIVSNKCQICNKPVLVYIGGDFVLLGVEVDGKKWAHRTCYENTTNCPQCESPVISYFRDNRLIAYCEDCGWPDEDFDEETKED